jgi:hypothetical protein
LWSLLVSVWSWRAADTGKEENDVSKIYPVSLMGEGDIKQTKFTRFFNKNYMYERGFAWCTTDPAVSA